MNNPAGSETVQELRMTEQQHQQLLMQKQQFQFEQNQLTNAINEVKKSEGDVFKVISGALIKVKKLELLKELEEKRNAMTLRVQSVEKQEKLIDEKMDSLQKELRNLIAKEKK